MHGSASLGSELQLTQNYAKLKVERYEQVNGNVYNGAIETEFGDS